MKCQLIILAAICLACTYSLPVPDEEVSVVQAAPVNEIKSDVAKKAQEEKPVDAASAVKAVESRAVEELKPAAEPAPAAIAPVANGAEPATVNEAATNEAQPELKKSTETKADLKSNVPDVETAPALPEKKRIDEAEKKPLVAAPAAEEAKKEAAPEEKSDKKTARTEEEPLEAPKAVPLVEAPVANVEVQKQIVDESKPAVHPALVAVGKSTELPKETKLESESKKEEKSEATPAAPAEETPAKKLPVEEFKEPQTAERAIELKSDESKSGAANANEPIVPAIAASEEGVAQEETKLIAEEKQPARQERINEQEKDAAAAPASAEAKPENNVQVIPAASTKSVASEEAKPAEQNAAAPADAQPELKQSAEQTKPIAEAQPADANIKSAAKENEQPTASVAAPESEPRKIEEAKEEKTSPASADLAGQENKGEPATKKSAEALKTSDEKKNSSDEKSELEKKSDESKDSSESKESEENDNSKEDKSN